jgi:serine phosphatase RsbU (regulator of sigma subunit)
VEAARADEEEFGEERLLSVLGQNRYSTPTEICSGILASVEQFLGNTAAQDDQTLVVVRLQPSRPEQIPTAASEVVLALD